MIDKAKKYKLLELTFAFDSISCSGFWRGRDVTNRNQMSLMSKELEYQIEQGNAVEVREPREFTTRGQRSAHSSAYLILADFRLPDWALEAESFEITIREVQ